VRFFSEYGGRGSGLGENCQAGPLVAVLFVAIVVP
jgi:hypothetical protein